MEEPIYHKYDPPYVWIRAYEYKDRKKLEYRRKQIYHLMAPQNPYYILEHVKIVQLACLTLNYVYDLAVHYEMDWKVLKANALETLRSHYDEVEFDVNKITDIVLTNNPYEKGAAIDDTKYPVYTAIADNSVVFFSQLKIDDVWIYFK